MLAELVPSFHASRLATASFGGEMLPRGFEKARRCVAPSGGLSTTEQLELIGKLLCVPDGASVSYFQATCRLPMMIRLAN